MVTMPYLTGRPSYGRGEESRPNNLTYVLTSNNASVDNDLSIRSFFIRLKGPSNYSATWNRDLREFISTRRLHIFADILALLNRHQPFSLSPATRFPEFETAILQPCCRTEDAYSATIKTLIDSRSEANVEEEWGRAIEEHFRHQLASLGIHPDECSVWIYSKVAEEWGKEAVQELQYKNAVQTIRNLARSRHMHRIHPSLTVWPHHGENRRRGLLWLGEDLNPEPHKVVRLKMGKPEVVLASLAATAPSDATPEKEF